MDLNLLFTIIGLIIGVLSLIGIKFSLSNKISWKKIDAATKKLNRKYVIMHQKLL